MWYENLVSKTSQEAGKILAEKSKEYSKVYSFPEERECKQKIAESFCEIWGSTEHSANYIFCLELVRLLSRDPVNIDDFLTDDLMQHLLSFSALNKTYEESQLLDLVSSFNEILEAQKAVSNALFQSEKARRIFLKLGSLESLVSRIGLHSSPDLTIDFEMRNYDIRLFFIITATCADIRQNCRDELRCLETLTGILIQIVSYNCAEKFSDGSPISLVLSREDSKITAEILKALFNLTMGVKSESISQATLEQCENLCGVSRLLILANMESSDVEEGESLKANVVNLLTTLPYDSYGHLIPPLADNVGIDNTWVYAGHDMRVVDELLVFLECRCDKPARVQKEMLHPILFLLCEIARCSPCIRKYMKLKVLPPLRKEVMRPPEEGHSLRNKIVKLMTSVTEIKDPAAEFLYILCKRNVDRLIKYTGFGNAAGHLANYGLMGGFRRPEPNVDDSPDEDSETEEYKNVKDQVNPVLGCFEAPRPDPMAGMSEEQKEHEAMKLVEQINKLMDTGVIRPATVGEDGRVRPVEHVLELQNPNGHAANGVDERNSDEDD